jgi:imidazolonepropionase-like amidohydrolase
MRERGAILVPTLVTYFAIDELGRKLGFPAVSQAKVKDVLEQGLASLEIARAANVPLGFGTDLLGETHDQQSREFRLRGQVLAPAEVIRSATVVNAGILNRPGELGVIAAGAYADLLVVDGDPLSNLALLAEPEKSLLAIVKGGRFVVDRL